MSNLVPCEHCEKPIARNAPHCPYCGGIPTSRTSLQMAVITILALIAVGLAAYFVLVLTREPAPQPAAVEAPAAVPAEKPGR